MKPRTTAAKERPQVLPSSTAARPAAHPLASKNPFATTRAPAAGAVKFGTHWILPGSIRKEIPVVKEGIKESMQKSDAKTSGSHLKFQPPDRSSAGRSSTSSTGPSNPFQESSVTTLSFDSESGLLFQLPFSQHSMVFTATELGTTLRCIHTATSRPRTVPIAFSLEPVDPKNWVACESPEKLFQQKWYSNNALDEIPLGYWMWRADWKLKQLAQGVVYDDVTGQQRPLRLGVDVPRDYPDVAQGDTGCARLWIVCRKVIRQPWGRHGLVIHPDKVQMGVEVRAQQFNESSGKYEDAKESPHSSAMQVAEYLSRNYDAVARFVPELQHCKRMAVLLDVAHWLLEGPLASKKLKLDQCIPDYVIPADFPKDLVPALHTVHEKGLQEEEKVKALDQELSQMKEHFNKASSKKEEEINSLQAEAETQMKRVEEAKNTLDQYSQKSVDACNLEVQKYNDLVEKRKAVVQSYNTAVDKANKAISTLLARRNAEAEACNAVRSRFAFVGGVDLALDVKEEPIKCRSDPLEKPIRQWADALSKHEKCTLLEAKSISGKALTLQEEILEEKNAILSVFPLTEPDRSYAGPPSWPLLTAVSA